MSLIVCLWGPGALVIVVRNLERMGDLDRQAARFYWWGSVGLLAALGMLAWSFDPEGFQKSPVLLISTLVTPFVAYFIQAPAFARWRREHPDLPPRPWMSALLPSLFVALLTYVVASVGIEILKALFVS